MHDIFNLEMKLMPGNHQCQTLAMLVLGWVTVSVLDQLWDVSKLEFLSVTQLL